MKLFLEYYKYNGVIQVQAIRYFPQVAKECNFACMEDPSFIKCLVVDDKAVAGAFNHIAQYHVLDKITAGK